MVSFVIPEQFRPGLIEIGSINQDEFAQLLKQLEDLRNTAMPEALSAELTARLESLDEEKIRQIIRSLVSVRLAQDHLRFGKRPIEFSRQVYQFLRECDYELKDEKTFCDRLVKLLQLETISVASKAVNLQQDQEHTFCAGRMLTDIRPVFGESTDQLPVGAVVLQTLKITYHHGRELKDFYVALDNDDIRTLEAVLERAKEKARTLNSVLDSAEIPNLSRETEVPNGRNS